MGQGKGESMEDGEGEAQAGKTRRNPDREKRVKRVLFSKDASGLLESKMCHQCQRNDKGKVVRCNKCKTKRYCEPCMTTWYPEMSENDFADACPVCRMKCNCKSCLRMETLRDSRKHINEKAEVEVDAQEKVRYSKLIIKELLPLLEKIDAEQKMECEVEAKVQGVSVSDVKVNKAKCAQDERMYCDICKTSIADYHRSCPLCSFDICLTCCQKLRDNVNPSEWKLKDNGVIPCPPKDRGGCGEAVLKLKCLFTGKQQVSNLLLEAKQFGDFKSECLEKLCSCSTSQNACKAAARENSCDNSLYCPRAVDLKHEDLQHFQFHWSKGEPINCQQCA